MIEAGKVWLLIGDKAGDNAQIELLPARLGNGVEYRRLTFLPRYRTGKPLFRASIHHVDRARSDPLQPPWPEVIVTSGRRPAMVALWIKERSGGRTRVAVIGRPKRWLRRFDLVVAPPQFAVPPAANVLKLTLPLMRVDADRLRAAAAAWETRLASLPRPLVAVLIGGSTFPYRLDADTARAVLKAAAGYAGSTGSLYVSTSRRTPADAAEALAANLPAGSRLYRWDDPAEDNPYPALLAHADAFVVTGDSMSMLTEVARERRPLAVFALRRGNGLRERGARVLAKLAAAIPAAVNDRVLEHLGMRAFPRDLERLHRWLYDRGLAVPVGQPLPVAPPGALPDDDVDAVVAAITALRTGGGAPSEH